MPRVVRSDHQHSKVTRFEDRSDVPAEVGALFQVDLQGQRRDEMKGAANKAAAWNGGFMQEWCILRVVGETVQTVSYVFAADEATAISEAIKKFDLVGRDLELVAHQVPQPPQSTE
jgi:hypothetical protein